MLTLEKWQNYSKNFSSEDNKWQSWEAEASLAYANSFFKSFDIKKRKVDQIIWLAESYYEFLEMPCDENSLKLLEVKSLIKNLNDIEIGYIST